MVSGGGQSGIRAVLLAHCRGPTFRAPHPFRDRGVVEGAFQNAAQILVGS